METKYRRRSIRLEKFDYSVGGFVPPTRYAAGTKPAARQPGAYFVTLGTYRRAEIFGCVVNGEMQLNRRGEIVKEEWFASTNIRKEIRLYPEEFVVMPNHVHGIVWIVDDDFIVGATGQSPLPTSPLHNHNPSKPYPHGPAKKSLASFIVGFKSSVTKCIRNEFGGVGVWQRNYYEHIIRNEKEWDVIRRYIESNPQNWETDEENPKM